MSLEYGEDSPGGSIKVCTQSFCQLTTEGSSLEIDSYQRGFVWEDARIEQLIEDLYKYQSLPDPKPSYYMGAVLLHRDKEKGKRFIIDGQQRLTALSILHHHLTGALPQGCAMKYSPQSEPRIRAAAKLYEEKAQDLKPDLARIEFTVISVELVDQAFIFFDTQNSRGVPLDATDLLKAFHLREMPSDCRRQTACATLWEEAQKGSSILPRQQGFMSSLFTHFLWRARRWTAQEAPASTRDALLKEFGKGTWKADGDPNRVPLYGTSSGGRAYEATLGDANRPTVFAITIKETVGCDVVSFPFALRQPIQRGLGFFLYTAKYAYLVQRLFAEPGSAGHIAKAREVYDKIMERNSPYLREIYLLAMLMYVDRFGDNQLYEYALWLEHALGAVRLEYARVNQETAKRFFVGREPSLMNTLAGAFASRQVIEVLKTPSYARPEVYAGKNSALDEQRRGGVHESYKYAVQQYFGKPEMAIAKKVEWIREQLGQCS